MIEFDRASLAIYSESRTVAEITASLLLEPTEAADIGEPTPAGRAGRNYKPEYLSYQRTTWIFDADTETVDSDDALGLHALERLVEIVLPVASSLESLRRDCETVIWWSGDSNHGQATFVLPASLIRTLASSAASFAEPSGRAPMDSDVVEFRFNV